MGDVVNLRSHRKRTMRMQEAKLAVQQRAKHGVTKQQRMLAKAIDNKASRTHNQQRLDTGEGQ
jgi:hypothetical protein